jgi:hypothetical protein
MKIRPALNAILFSILAVSVATQASAQAPKKPPSIINPPPTAQDWTDLGKLPDWSGVWNPKISDQEAQVKTNPPPWNAHNAMEILFTPGRVTMLGESDGNRIRRIYTDGRAHPDVSDPTFHGHSIGHWEGDTLVVDTVDILPQAPLAVSEAAGVSNNGDMRVVERIHLADKDILHVDLEIFAPKILTKPWKTTRIFFRQRARKFDIVEGVCAQGDLAERVNAEGDHVFVPVEKSAWGNTIAVPAK